MSELRIDPVCGRCVYIAEDRAGRPNDFASGGSSTPASPSGDRKASCPFCAGHEAETPEALAEVRDAEGRWQVRVVPNKYPAVASQAGAAAPLGAHEVIIESPAHVAEVFDLAAAQFATVLGVYRDRLRHWAGSGAFRHGIVFKNSGSAAGASIEHVHSQLIALPYVPELVQAELTSAERFYAENQSCLFCELVQREQSAGDRLVLRRDGYVAFCAYAGRQPFETWILPERHAARFERSSDDELAALAAVLQDVLRRLQAQADSLAYNLILHTAPWDGAHDASYHWHWELIPRSSQLAGFELGAGVYINPVSPERAARNLRDAVDASPSS
jgi:UDPglucose--hexose-1-phosphate uridylyltransferase